MPTRVKICGISRAQDAALAIELGASALGFNFYPKSPRYVTPAAARAVIRELPPLVMSVGVFADETDGEPIAALAAEAGVRAIQLHGPRFPALTAPGALDGYPLIRAVPMEKRFSLETLRELQAAAFLLDTLHSTLPGGTGRTFDWSLARQAKRFGRIILAGGLTPENVGQAIREVRPFAVDVASGVESSPGIKDTGKLRAFFAAVEQADELAEFDADFNQINQRKCV